jgi:hypothetical protein
MRLPLRSIPEGTPHRRPPGSRRPRRVAAAIAAEAQGRFPPMQSPGSTCRRSSARSPISPPCVACGLDGGRVGHAETAGNIGRARLAAAGQQICDEFDIVLEQRSRLRGAGLSEPARLGQFGRKFRGPDPSLLGVSRHPASPQADMSGADFAPNEHRFQYRDETVAGATPCALTFQGPYVSSNVA